MDKDFIGLIFAIILSVIIAWVERAGKKKSAKASSAPVHAPATRAAAGKAVAKQRAMADKSPRPPQQKPAFLDSSTEGRGATVIAAETPAPMPRKTPALTLDQLRNAVIWGEILQRKF